MAYTQVDLTMLSAPDVIEVLSYETILADMKAAVAVALPAMAPVLQIEGEPAVKVLEVCAAFVLMTRARVNDGARAVMLAFAQGTDLDHIGGMFGVERKVYMPVSEAGPAILEDDETLRYRIQLSLEGLSTAGPRAAYEFHALSAHPEIKDVFVAGPDTAGLTVPPGNVHVYVLGRTGSGVAAVEVLDAVRAALNAERVRPLCDTVTVMAPTIQNFAVTATIYRDEDATLDVQVETEEALNAYLAETHRIGAIVARSGILAALHQPGVRRVVLTSPAADIVPAPNVAPYVTAVNLTLE